jgi:hypothetical protein
VLLVCILRHLSQRDRLTTCAVVSTSWAAASNRATTDIELPTATDQVIAAFQPWLQQHAGQLESLELAHDPPIDYPHPRLDLPFGNLQQLNCLDLKGVEIKMVGPIAPEKAVLPSLVELKLEDCWFSDSTAQLPQLPGVTRFKMYDSGSEDTVSVSDRSVKNLLPAVLQCLPALARLSAGYRVDFETIASTLPAETLTSLSWAGCIGMSDSISRLTQLQKLKYVGSEVFPAELACLSPQLIYLRLDGSELQGSVTDFLAAVSGMLQLQHLSVRQDFTDSDMDFVLSADPRGPSQVSVPLSRPRRT